MDNATAISTIEAVTEAVAEADDATETTTNNHEEDRLKFYSPLAILMYVNIIAYWAVTMGIWFTLWFKDRRSRRESSVDDSAVLPNRGMSRTPKQAVADGL
uniref:Uncharacterized protein n=1 Tax=Panagrellus redivivus TaxID=6233 RepID=A0A7E4WAF8_PANRE